MILRPRLMERIKEHEGFVPYAYQDHMGFWTLGYGRLIDERRGGGISPEEAEMLLRNDLWAAERASEQFPWFDRLDAARQEVIIEMVFQLGFSGVSRFQKMIRAIRDEDWTDAAREMRDSAWHAQTPARCEELANIMEHGI